MRMLRLLPAITTFVIAIALFAVIPSLAQSMSIRPHTAPTTDQVVLVLPIGSGISQVGINVPLREDEEPNGPEALRVNPDGSIYVLDTINHRILSSNSSGQVSQISVPGEGYLRDLAIANGLFYVMDVSRGAVLALSATGTLVETYTAPLDLQDFSSGIAVDEMNHVLWQVAGEREAVLRPASSNSRPLAAVRRDGISVSARSGDLLSTRLERDATGTAVLDVQADGLTYSIPIRSDYYVGSATLLRRDGDGNFYVLVEELLPNVPAFIVDTTVRRYDASGRFTGAARVPIDDLFAVPSRFVDVDPTGQIYFLEVREGDTRVLQLAMHPDIASHLAARWQIQKDSAYPLATHPVNTTQSTITRDQIMATAASYVDFEWTISSSNLNGSTCTSGNDLGWVRPPYLSGVAANTRVRSVAYKWGGYDTVSSYAAGMAAGKAAGDTAYNNIRACASGVDCSGYVSRVWNEAHYTTRSLTNVSHQLSSWNELLRGDAANWSAGHVLIFDSFNSQGLNTYESTSNCSGKTCRYSRAYTYLNQKYVPVRYNNVVGSTPEGWLDSPVNGATTSGTTRISGWARVNGGTISRVEIWIDGVNRGNATYGTWRGDAVLQANVGWYWDWDTRSFSSGSHTIQARAFAQNGASVILSASGANNTNTVTVQNDTTPPSGNITAPVNNSVTSNLAFIVTADASDTGSGVQFVDFYIGYDDAFHAVCRDTSAPYSCTWSAVGLADQRLVFTIHVHDSANNLSVDPGGYRFVTLDRTAPTASIGSLAAVQSSSSFSVSWGGQDNLSGIARYKVEYTDNGGSWQTWLANETRTTGSFTGVDGHAYAFRVTAFDGAGNASPPATSATTTVQTVQPDGYESDDSSGTATLLSGTQVHNFHMVGDVDWVVFYIPANTTYALRTAFLNLNVDTIIDLYSYSDLSLLASNDDWGGDLSSRLDLRTATGGYFYAAVRAFASSQTGSDSSYTLILAPGDAYEDVGGDMVSQIVTPISDSSTHTAHVPGDIDRITFAATAGTPYTLLTKDLGAMSDTILEVDTSGGTLSNDDAPLLGLASRLDFVAEEAVSARVRQYNRSVYGPDTSYTLLVAQGDTYEHDNTPATAQALFTDGTLIQHTIHVPGDVDWHRVVLTAGNHYAFTTFLDGSQADVTLALYAADGATLLALNTDYHPSLGWDATVTGDYYLQIKAWSPIRYGPLGLSGYRVRAVVDNDAPTGSIETASLYTRQAALPLQITAIDAGSGVYQMQFASYSDSQGGWAFTNWEPYQQQYTYTLTDDEGERVIWVHFKDRAENYSDWFAATVIYDQQMPQLELHRDDAGTDWNGIFLSWSARDQASGIEYLALRYSKNSGAWQERDLDSSGGTGAIFFGEPGATYQFALRAVDYAGNEGLSATTVATSIASCELDLSEPDGSAAKARGAQAPFSTRHTVCAQGDEDWVAFQATAGITYLIQTSDLSLADTVLSLYGSDGASLIMENDDVGEGALSSSITWQAPANATYFVRVREYNHAVAGSTVAYTLSIVDNQSRVYLPMIMRGDSAFAAPMPLLFRDVLQVNRQVAKGAGSGEDVLQVVANSTASPSNLTAVSSTPPAPPPVKGEALDQRVPAWPAPSSSGMKPDEAAEPAAPPMKETIPNQGNAY